MEKAILVAIGIAAVGYVLRIIWKEAKGEVQCACSGSCDKKGCCSIKKEE